MPTDTAAPAAAPAAATPPANPSVGGTIPGPSSSPVNATSAASQANQQAVAAGETKGLTNKDGTVTDQGTTTPPIPDGNAAAPSLDTARFTPSGNKHIDQINNLLVNASFDGADAIINEVTTTQELSLTSKAKLVDKLGADVAQLVIEHLETSVAAVKEAGAVEGKRLKDYAFQKFGGNDPQETWNGLQQFAQSQSANLSADDKKAMNEMLNAGGIKAELVIDSLFSKYKESDQYVERPALMQGDATNSSNMSLVTKKQYQEQIGPAVAKYGEQSQEVAALRQRRQFSLLRGHN